MPRSLPYTSSSKICRRDLFLVGTLLVDLLLPVIFGLIDDLHLRLGRVDVNVFRLDDDDDVVDGVLVATILSLVCEIVCCYLKL